MPQNDLGRVSQENLLRLQEQSVADVESAQRLAERGTARVLLAWNWTLRR